jgi:uncharacterized protein YneF (UPF0154 family)
MEVWLMGLITLVVGFVIGFALGWCFAFRVITQWMDQ